MTSTSKHSPCTLPPGTVVLVTQPGLGAPFRGRIVGTDVHGTKYEIGREGFPGHYDNGGWWAFPREVQPVEGATQ